MPVIYFPSFFQKSPCHLMPPLLLCKRSFVTPGPVGRGRRRSKTTIFCGVKLESFFCTAANVAGDTGLVQCYFSTSFLSLRDGFCLYTLLSLSSSSSNNSCSTEFGGGRFKSVRGLTHVCSMPGLTATSKNAAICGGGFNFVVRPPPVGLTHCHCAPRRFNEFAN